MQCKAMFELPQALAERRNLETLTVEQTRNIKGKRLGE
jgi:hypothetical protein